MRIEFLQKKNQNVNKLLIKQANACEPMTVRHNSIYRIFQSNNSSNENEQKKIQKQQQQQRMNYINF